MTNPIINPQPNYSGVTIQISNPAVYAGGSQGGSECANNGYKYLNPASMNYSGNSVTNPILQNPTPQNANPYAQLDTTYNAIPAPQTQAPAYPPQYYLNNYNYTNNGTSNGELPNNTEQVPQIAEASEVKTPEDIQSAQDVNNTQEYIAKQNEYEAKTEEPQDFTKSQAVIDDLDARAAAMEEEKKNSTQKRIVALTDEYIKSLENYLNNPNDEIRLMASKEILTRLDEDKDRYDDAALNALLNKMLQDPSKLIRVAALSAFASQLASGNDYTVQLLQNIQQNPSADKEDVIQAADILLKMSAGTEVKNIPNPAVKETPVEENKG